jgi:crotonobetaine/carnitine-CoA ligase
VTAVSTALGPTIDGLLTTRAATHPETVFLRFASGDLTFADVDRRVTRLAAGLASIGVERGDVVPVLLPNSPEFAIAWLALCRLGAVACLVNTGFRGPTLRHVLGTADSTLMILDAELVDDVLAVATELATVPNIVLRGDVDVPHGVRVYRWTNLISHAGEPPVPTHGPLDPAMVLFTSGTTGVSKGCLLPHRYTVRQASLMAEHLQFTAEDVFYCPFPMFHIDALVLTIGPALVLGTTAAIGVRYSASGFWDEVRRFGATVFDFMGATLTLTWKQPPTPHDHDHPVRLAWGVPVPDFCDDFERRFDLRLVELYGSTDAGVPIYSPLSARRTGSCGRPIDAYDVRLIDDDGFEVPVDAVGEIAVRPLEPGLMSSGYLGMPQATLDSRRDLWFHTGDLARRDADGYYYFIGRRSDVIRRRGENISAFEVEEIVKLHPNVLDAAAFGVPSELTEDDVMVTIVLRAGTVPDPADIARFCSERAAAHMIPRYIDIAAELPVTATEKVRKELLRERGVTNTTWDRERNPLDGRPS